MASEQREEASFGNSTDIHQEVDENREEDTVPVVAGEDCEDNHPAACQHVCEYCGDVFSSGDALGGHMRMHGNNKKISRGSYNLDGNEKSDEHPCSVCPRKFSSSKALYGHMRSHPERDWRGIRPPAPTLESLVSLLELKWLVKGIRGRKSVVDEVPKSAISALLKLSEGAAETGRGPLLSKDQNNEASERMKIVENGYSVKRKATMVETEFPESGDEEYVKVEDNGSEGARYLKRKRSMSFRQLKVGEGDGNSRTPSTSCLKTYECSTCNKCFSSKQGLGGHMSSSSHKIKQNAIAKMSIIGDEDLGNDNNVDDAALLLMALACNQDRFKISNGTVREAGNDTRRNVHMFDLNELPSMDDDEEHS